jgi:polyisoprenoid-binding protein YceI
LLVRSVMNFPNASTAHLQVALAVVIAMLAQPTPRASGRQPIDAERSIVTLHVGKSGVFRAFADNHEIRGTVRHGFVNEDAGAVELVIDARELRVVDPKLSPKDRVDVQTRMLGADVLDVDRYPDIRFVSNRTEKAPEGWTVHGQLTLRGKTALVTGSVTGRDHRYTGSARVKQSDFGITPITVAGGTVKVKDEVLIDFDITTRTSSTTGQ